MITPELLHWSLSLFILDVSQKRRTSFEKQGYFNIEIDYRLPVCQSKYLVQEDSLIYCNKWKFTGIPTKIYYWYQIYHLANRVTCYYIYSTSKLVLDDQEKDWGIPSEYLIVPIFSCKGGALWGINEASNRKNSLTWRWCRTHR